MLYEGLQLSRYRLVRLIGRGGAGDVYLGEDQRIKRQVALKLVQSEDTRGETGSEAMRLFQREAETIAMLSHPHILPLFDYGEEVVNGITVTYLVTPFCPEGSLVTWLRRRRGTLLLSPQGVDAIVQQAADALAYAHEQNIVHRDVKPSNFLVRVRKDAPDRVDLLLADFGIARITQATLNASKTIRGTPTYMAPEQWSSNPVPATDQYALAVMVYELLTNRPPFQGTQEQMMYQHLMVQPQPPSAINAKIPPAIDAVVLRALAKQPSARYPSIAEFAQAFQQAVATLPAQMTNAMQALTSSAPSGNKESGENTVRAVPSLSVPFAQINPSTPIPPVRNTPEISAPSLPPSNDIYATLSVSMAEAMAGVERTLTLPGQRHLRVAIPAGSYDGQVFRIENQLNPTLPNTTKGNIIVTLAIAPTIPSAVIEPIPGMSQPRIKWRLFSIVGLVAVVLIASVAGLFSIGSNQFSSHFTQATQTASAGTVQALQSNYATATVQAGNNATATAQAAATAAITANPYDSSQKNLVLNDTLSQNSNSGWDSGNANCAFTGGSYHVVSTGQATQVCIAHHGNYGDMTFQVQLNILKGNGGGILFRSTNSASYYFRIGQDGKYALFACGGNGTACNKTLSSNFSSSITSDSNILAVLTNGNSIHIYINNSEVDAITDSSSLQGQIGVVADAQSGLAFSNVKIWTA